MTNIPSGFRAAGVACGIKSAADAKDLALIVADQPCVAAGVYTSNRYVAAPVIWDRGITPSDRVRAVVVNSGNANACTGQRGMDDNQQMATWVGAAVDAAAEQVLVMSTGIIGEFLPMQCVQRGVASAAQQLSADTDGWQAAADAILTTDSCAKLASSAASDDAPFSVAGIAKGAGMIGPRMATMLAVVLTDADLQPDAAQNILAAAVQRTFNCISVEGHMSTNDTVLLLASGRQRVPEQQVAVAVEEVCQSLARAIPADGEGAQHLITLDIEGCRSFDQAREIARTIADSALVKTAVKGADPNWGRIMSAAGYAPISFNPSRVELAINGTTLFSGGAPVVFDAAAVSASMRQPEVHVRLTFSEGDQGCRFWTSDLTEQYIHINADYHT